MGEHYLSEVDFAELAGRLEREAGLVFDNSRREALGYSVLDRMRELGSRTVSAYLAALDDPAELQRLLDVVTVPETHFFRNPPQVRTLRAHVLPELVRRAAAGNRRLRVWSAGCSTGEEPYTVAMCLRELLPDLTGWDVKVVGTDISGRALAAAARATYGPRSLVMTEPADVERFFVPAKGGGHVVRPEVRDLVELHRHNLVTEPPPFAPGEVDLVLCRNVTIYFGRDTTRALVERLHAVTAPGGYLFLGHAETLWQVSAEFQLVELGDAYVYRRDAEPRMLLPDRRIVEEGPPPLGMGPERRLRARRSPLPPVALARQVDRLLAVARLALREGDYAAAAEQAFAAARLEPMRAEAWYLRGVAFVNDRRDEEAVIDLRKACYADPDAGFTHFVLAGVLARLGQRGAAAHEYRAAAETLGRPGDETAAELGGRTLGELVTLCGRLATTMEREDRRERPA